MATIGITGGTGFVGKHLQKLFTEGGHNVVIFSRNADKKSKNPNVSFAHWNPDAQACDTDALQTLDAVIHLAGAGVADKRWTDKRKQEIVDSRVIGTRFLVKQLKAHAPKCKTLVSASAIGYYGPDRDGLVPFKEENSPSTDFLATTCEKWEAEALPAASFLRLCTIRIGIVLGHEGGAYPQFANPLKFGVMPILGAGKQIVSWIHVDDLARIMEYAVFNEALYGVYNAVAPFPVSNKELMQTLAKAKGGISIPVQVPSFALKLALGEMSIEVLKSCTVSAAKVLETGFQFGFNTLKEAAEDLQKRQS